MSFGWDGGGRGRATNRIAAKDRPPEEPVDASQNERATRQAPAPSSLTVEECLAIGRPLPPIGTT
jgi:hypothetical protein